MKYTLDWMEKKTTSTGKHMIKATLTSADGVVTNEVTIWDNFPGFSELMAGSTLEGEISIKPTPDGKYVNKTLNAPRASGHFGGGRVATEEVRAKNIEKAQDRKEESIAYFNSCNLALQAMGPLYAQPDMTEAEYFQRFLSMRDRFLKEWENKAPF